MKARPIVDTAKKAGEVTANAVNRGTSVIARNEEKIADVAQAVTHGIGGVIDSAGMAGHRLGMRTGARLHQSAAQAASAVARFVEGEKPGTARKITGLLARATTRIATHAGGATFQAMGLTAKGIGLVGKGTKMAAGAVGGAAGGLIAGAADTLSNVVDAGLLSPSEIRKLQDRLRFLGQQNVLLTERIRDASRRRDRQTLLELLTVGGVTLAEVLRNPQAIHPQIEQAFQLAYPRLHDQGETFASAASRMETDQLVGLLSGVKGKLFELQLVEHLNENVLPAGQEAVLAQSSTQAGWDIRVLDDGGNTVDLIQAKATESAQYVQDAMERYPSVDVTTTSEVHAQLAALNMAEGAVNSGISNAALEAQLQAAMESGQFNAADILPSGLGLAVIALSSFLTGRGDLRQVGSHMGTRTAKASGATMAGKAAMLVTQTWWVAVVTGVGSSLVLSRGEKKRLLYGQLQQAVASIERQHERRPVLGRAPVPLLPR